MNRRLLQLAAIFAASSMHLSAQSASPSHSSPKPLTFDVASIKSDTSGNGRHSLSINLDGGRMHAVNVPVSSLIVRAYRVPKNRIVGAPDWLEIENFDIEATHDDPGPNDSTTDDGNDIRLQALLADRFKLSIHRETRQMRVYSLVLVSSGQFGPTLQLNRGNCDNSQKLDSTPGPAASVPESGPTALKCGDISSSGANGKQRILARGVSVDRLIESLSNIDAELITRPIVDRTGIAGTIDFTLEFAAPLPFSSEAAAVIDPSRLPSLETALQQQLGLKLSTARGPMEVIVIDRVTRPSAN